MTLSTNVIPAILMMICICVSGASAQDIVTDYDGNEYHSIEIGSQVWLQENLKCLHYADGTEIPQVVAYDNSESNANLYGRLYTWDAAMRGSTQEGAQGICPDGWHIPSDAEWKVLEDHLGGASVAGGKLKESGLDHWKFSNVGADNSSGFTALPGGEYDAHDAPNQFRLLRAYAVLWTSTEVNPDFANERYIAYNSAECSSLNWYKVMKYSIRAIKDSETTGLYEDNLDAPESWLLHPNSPNPFNPSTTIPFQIGQASLVKIRVFDIKGTLVKTLLNAELRPGYHEISWQGLNNLGEQMESGIYLVILDVPGHVQTRKMTLIR